MKQKMVIKVSMNGEKSRSKAMKIAVSFYGVESAALKGDDKTQIEITGDGVDAVELATMLRKKLGSANLISVAQVKPEEKQPETKQTKVQPVVWHCENGVTHYQPFFDNNYRECYYETREDSCTIL